MKPLQQTSENNSGYKIEKESRSLQINPKNGINITLEPSKISRFLGIIAIILLAASLCSNFLTEIDVLRRFGRLLNVDEEKNLPTCYAVFLLQFAATLLFIISTIKWKKSFSIPFTGSFYLQDSFLWLLMRAGLFMNGQGNFFYPDMGFYCFPGYWHLFP